jgi:hypothetical protein
LFNFLGLVNIFESSSFNFFGTKFFYKFTKFDQNLRKFNENFGEKLNKNWTVRYGFFWWSWFYVYLI